MRIAIIADIHGNLQALDCVLKDLRQWAPDVTVAAGDLVFKYADSLAVLEALGSIDHVALRGNADERVSRAFDRPLSSDEHPIHMLARYTHKTIGTKWCEYLKSLPDHVLLSVIVTKMGSILLVTAHIHRQHHRRIGWTDVVNPGPVMGQHIYRQGVPVAEYLVCDLVPRLDIWTYIFRQVAYDHHAAVEQVRALQKECPAGGAWALREIASH